MHDQRLGPMAGPALTSNPATGDLGAARLMSTSMLASGSAVRSLTLLGRCATLVRLQRFDCASSAVGHGSSLPPACTPFTEPFPVTTTRGTVLSGTPASGAAPSMVGSVRGTERLARSVGMWPSGWGVLARVIPLEAWVGGVASALRMSSGALARGEVVVDQQLHVVR